MCPKGRLERTMGAMTILWLSFANLDTDGGATFRR